MALNNPYALSFDGVDDYGEIPHANIQKEYPVTFEIAIATTQIISQPIEIFGKHDSTSGSTYGYSLNYDQKHYIWFVVKGSSVSSYPYLVKNINLTDGVPRWISICVSTNKMEMLVDGVVEDSYLGSVPVAGNYVLRIAKSLSSYFARFKGLADEFRIWNTYRTPGEIQSTMGRYLRGDEQGLGALYRFDEGFGSVANDSSPNANHGTIYGASWVPGLIDLHLPGEVLLSATLRGSSSFRVGEPERIRGLSANLKGSSLITAKPERIRGLSATLQGSSSVSARMNLIASLKAHLQGKATLKSTMLVLFIPSGVYVIDADEIFDRNQPMRSQSFANYIEVKVNPLKPVDVVEEVYKSSDPIDIAAGETKTISIQFKSKPVIEATARIENAPTGAAISNVKYYAWGADVTVTSTTAGTFDLIIDGKPLKVQGEEIVVAKDEQSILENGIKKYTFDNPFVQDRATAKTIGQHLLKFADPRSDITIDWRGDPAVVLADVTMIPEYRRGDVDQRGVYYITKQELNFDSGLRVQTEGRKM